MTDGASEMILAVENGQVILRFPEPKLWIAFDAQNAFDLAEAMSRSAHEARFGKKAPTDGSYLAAQVRARLTEEMRERLIQRIALVLTSLREQGKTPGQTAVAVVDRILTEVA